MVQEGLKKIVVICGPTAVGKSRVAIDLAGRFSGEIVNADSGQVWRGLDIGTAKPGPAESLGVAHHLIDVIDPGGHFDASLFVKLADDAIKYIIERKKTPFVVGGTGMYIRMLTCGLCEAPPRNPEIRKRLDEIIDLEGIEELYDRLAKIDPVTAKVVHRNDKTRIVRALEIFEETGVSASQFYNRHRFKERRYDALKIGLSVDKKDLYDKIDIRVDEMLKKGWVKEVENLLKNYGGHCQAFSAIGYREIVSYLEGKMPLEAAVSVIKRNSRHYAKRQITWFKSDKEIIWFNPAETDKMAEKISVFLSD